MIAVLGHLVVDPENRDSFLAVSLGAIQAARRTPGCLHFTVTADPVEPAWVAIAELWSSRAELEAFRSSPSGEDDANPFAYVREFHVTEYDVADL